MIDMPRRPPRVVVTGAAGFIGSHLADTLLRTGTLVTGIDRRDIRTCAAAAANLARLTPHPNYTAIKGDLLTCDLRQAIESADVVYHLAGIPGVRPSWGRAFAEYVRSNILATQRLMDTATALGVPRVVVASSSSVYGTTDGSPSSEDDEPRPASPYAVTKLAEEHLCLAHAARPGCPTTVVALRYFTVYGPRQRSDMFIHRALLAAISGTPLRVYGHGRQRRDFTFIDDAVNATISAANAHPEAGVINVGGGTTASLQDVIDLARSLTSNNVPVEHHDARCGDVPATRADPSKAHRLLGWTPQTDLMSGMKTQLAHLQEPKATTTKPAP